MDYKNIHPHDLAIMFKDLEEQERIAFYKKIDLETLSEMIVYLDPIESKAVLDDFELHKQIEMIDYMDPDDAVDIIQILDKPHQEKLLDGLDDQDSIIELLTYDELEAGAFMTSSILRLLPDMDCKLATKKVIKSADEAESIRYLFVVDDQNSFLGVVSLKNLIKARLPLLVKDILEDYPTVLDTSLMKDAIVKMKDYGAYELPVLNSHKKLVGMITLDDALENYHDEAVEDFEMLSALKDTDEKNVMKSALKRLPWLVLLLVLSVPIAFLSTAFEAVLVAVAVLALFQPLILDAAGDVATQTLAVTLRALSKNRKDAINNGKREILTGVVTGLLLGVAAMIMAFLIAKTLNSEHDLILAIVVGLSLWITVILGPVFGFLIPVTLDKLKIDPAVASGPLITTLIDIFSLLIYFGLATMMLGGL